MTLPTINLDDRGYAELVEEARALIPSLYPEWTHHNPTDPGITLIELLAWLTEMLLYRANQVPDRHLITFLRLLRAPNEDWQPGSDLDEAIRETILAVRSRYRAVTCGDYEALAGQASPQIARSKCVPRRYLDAGTEAERERHRSGYLSIIVLPKQNGALSTVPFLQPDRELLQTIKDYLEPRRLLTTRLHIVGPSYAPVSAEILVARRADFGDDEVKKEIADKLNTFLAPQPSSSGEGWPFGRNVYVSELYELLEAIPGVDYVPAIDLSSSCPANTRSCVAAARLWHDDGDLIGLGLAAHHLPQPRIEQDAIVVSAVFIPVRITIQATPATAVEPKEARRIIKTTLRRLFHPLHEGPNGKNDWEIRLNTIEAILTGRAELELARITDLHIEPPRRVRDELGNLIGISIKARELADVTVIVKLTSEVV